MDFWLEMYMLEWMNQLSSIIKIDDMYKSVENCSDPVTHTVGLLLTPHTSTTLPYLLQPFFMTQNVFINGHVYLSTPVPCMFAVDLSDPDKDFHLVLEGHTDVAGKIYHYHKLPSMNSKHSMVATHLQMKP